MVYNFQEGHLDTFAEFAQIPKFTSREAEKVWLLAAVGDYQKWSQRAHHKLRRDYEKQHQDSSREIIWENDLFLCVSCPYFKLQSSELSDCQSECGQRSKLTKEQGQLLLTAVCQAWLGA